ncbi:unnamed protein product, partial [Mycena citricolor]
VSRPPLPCCRLYQRDSRQLGGAKQSTCCLFCQGHVSETWCSPNTQICRKPLNHSTTQIYSANGHLS